MTPTKYLIPRTAVDIQGPTVPGAQIGPPLPELELVHYTIPLRRVRTSHVAFLMNPAPWLVHK